MNKAAPRDKLRPQFWELPLTQLNPLEWEALCDGCGKCCLNKLEYEDTGEIDLTKIACRLLDTDSCKCSHYENRKTYVPECVVLTMKSIGKTGGWLPRTCAYRLRLEGKPLFGWHPLISGDPESVHKARKSARGVAIPEYEVAFEDWEDHILEGC